MNTKYGEMNDDFWINYFNSLLGYVYKILPMKEENSDTLDTHIKSLLRELNGARELAEKINYDSRFISICNVLQNLLSEDDIDIYRSDVFKCMTLIKKIQSSLGGDLNGH